MTVLKIVTLFILQAVSYLMYIVMGFAALWLAASVVLVLISLPWSEVQVDELQGWLVFFAVIGAFTTIGTVANVCDKLFNLMDAERKATIVRWKYDRETRRLYPNAKPSLDFS